MIPIDVPGVRKLPSENLIDEKSETKATGYSTGVGESEMGIADEFSGIDGGIEFLSNEEQYEKNVENVLKKVEEGKRLNPNEEKIRIEEGILTYEDINRKGKTQKTIEEIIEEKKVPDKLPDTTLLEVLDDEDNEESIDIDPKKAIAEPLALTLRRAVGEVVPIPTLPPDLTTILYPPSPYTPKTIVSLAVVASDLTNKPAPFAFVFKTLPTQVVELSSTSIFIAGAVVPIPTFPVSLITKFLLKALP